MIFEVATNPGRTAKYIQLHVGFDQGYLSRLVERLTRAGLIRRTKSADDQRAQNLFLTPAGKKAFKILNERADDQARQLTAHLNDNEAIQLRNALRVVQRLLDSEVPLNRSISVNNKSATLVGLFTGRPQFTKMNSDTAKSSNPTFARVSSLT